MILYNSILFFIFICMNLKNSNLRKVIYIFSFVILLLLVGMRGKNIGNDSIHYAMLINYLTYKNIDSIYMEKGFLLYVLALKNLTREYYLLFFTTSLIVFYGIYKVIKSNSSNIIFSLYLLVSLRYYGSTMAILRQMIALSLILVGFEYLKKKNYKLFFFFNQIATTFHISAVVFFIMFFLSRIKFTKKKMLIILAISIFCLILNKKLIVLITKVPILNRYFNYIDSQYFTSWNLGSIFTIMLSFFVMVLYYHYYIENKALTYIKNLNIWIVTMGFLFASTSLIGSLLSRVALYFIFFHIIFIPNIIRKTKHSKLYTYIVVLVLFFYHLITYSYKYEWNKIYPYKFFWQ